MLHPSWRQHFKVPSILHCIYVIKIKEQNGCLHQQIPLIQQVLKIMYYITVHKLSFFTYYSSMGMVKGAKDNYSSGGGQRVNSETTPSIIHTVKDYKPSVFMRKVCYQHPQSPLDNVFRPLLRYKLQFSHTKKNNCQKHLVLHRVP